MSLLINGEKRVAPTEQNIVNAVKDLNSGTFEFIILEHPSCPEFFMQTTGQNDDFQLEYKDGESDKDHYYALETVTSQELIKALVAYKNEDEQFKQLFTWDSLWKPQYKKNKNGEFEKIPPSEQKSSKGCMSVLLVIMTVIASVFFMTMF